MEKQLKNKSLLTLVELPNWKMTAWRPNEKMWSLDKGVFHAYCSNSWIGHSEIFSNFRFECELLFDGYGGGDIDIRSDREAPQTWEHGYNFAIGPNDNRTHGRIILTNPMGHHQKGIEFNLNEWVKLTILAEGNRIRAYLNEKDDLKFTDNENLFPSGQICLSDQSCQKGDDCNCDCTGHIKYRNLNVYPITQSGS